MMMSDLPLDLVEEILSRVPATSMKRFRTTCKRWNALFQDRRFTEKHLSKAPKESMVLMVKEYRLCSISVNLNVAPPTIEIKGGIGLKDPHYNLEEVDIVEVFHCNGLLLCVTKDNRPVVWNPCLGETRWIQPKTSYEWYHSFAVGYEKKKSGHSYKILMWWDSDDIPLNRVNDFEIYEFNSDSWRVLDNVALDCTIFSKIGVSLKGNCYWLAYDKKDMYNDFILCFDFTTERFKRMCLPPLVLDEMTLSVVEEQRLSVVSQSDSTSEIWITNKIDTDIEIVLKWSKSFAVDIPVCRNYSPLFLSFIIDEEKKVALCCEVLRSRRRYALLEIESTNNLLWWHSFVFSYVPSLVQIQL